jgi:AbiV family abortive infection protein
VKLFRDRLSVSETDAKSWKSFWKEFTRHEVKWLTLFEQTFTQFGTTYRDARAVLDETSQEGLEEIKADFLSGASIKNEGIYVDYDETLHSCVEPGAIPEHRTSAQMLLDLGDLFEKSLKETGTLSS